jgi:transcriptional regulator with XRE-family HTH domain
MSEIFILPYMRTEFGQRLYDARKRAKKTQVQLCKAVGMSQGNYTDLETSGQSSGFTPKIAAFLGVSVQWLAYGEGEMTAESLPLSQAGQVGERFERWLNKINDRDVRERVADAAMQIVYQALDRQAGLLPQPTPEPEAQSKKPHASRQGH